MNIFRKLAIATLFLGGCLLLAAHAHEPQQLLADPGFRPESGLSAAFVERVSSAQIAVFPTIIKTTDETAYSATSSQWTVEFLALNDLGTGSLAATRFDTGPLQRASQWQMFQSSMAIIGGRLGELKIQGDYALVVEILIPPVPGKSVSMEVFGVHCFVLEPDGKNAFSFLLNSHHQAFNDARLRTTETGAKGRERLAIESTRLALMALQAQVVQEREAAKPGSTNVSTSIVDDFESGLPSGTDHAGLPMGFHTFADATSTANITTTTSHPPLAGEKSGNAVLRLDLNVTGWAGFIHAFENEAVDKWTSHDWKASLGVRFWLHGNNTGTSLFVDVLDNRKRYSTTDDAERYTYQFTDDFSGWKQIIVPFSKMVRKEIGNNAPQDGLNLSQVHGWAFGNSSSVGKITWYIDDFELYGGRVNLPGEASQSPTADASRWRNLQAKEGHFQIAVAVRMDPPAGIEPSDAARLAVFDWRYRHRADGMPRDEQELKAILAWARRLDDLLVTKRDGFQFANRGGANKLSAFFYVADVGKLKNLSQEAGEQALNTELDFSVSEDPNWETWRKMGRPPADQPRWATDLDEGTAIPVSALDPVLRFNGFSVRRPNDHRWRLQRIDRADMAVFSFAPLSATHSFNASIMLRGLSQEFHSQEAFKAFVDFKIQETSARFELLSYDSSMTELHGQWAVEYQALFLDKAPTNSAIPLRMAIKGVLYVHPMRERRAIDAFYSERGTKEDLDGSLDPVGEALIHGTIPEK